MLNDNDLNLTSYLHITLFSRNSHLSLLLDPACRWVAARCGRITDSIPNAVKGLVLKQRQFTNNLVGGSSIRNMHNSNNVYKADCSRLSVSVNRGRMQPGCLMPNRQESRKVANPMFSLLVSNFSLPLVLYVTVRVLVSTLPIPKCVPNLGAMALKMLCLTQDGCKSHMGWQPPSECFPSDPGNHRGTIFIVTQQVRLNKDNSPSGLTYVPLDFLSNFSAAAESATYSAESRLHLPTCSMGRDPLVKIIGFSLLERSPILGGQ